MEKEKLITHWDEKNQVACIKLIGEFDDEHARIAVGKEREFMDELEESDIVLKKVMYDITEAGDATDKAKRIFAGFAKSVANNFRDIKFAYVGNNKLAMMVSMFIHRISGIGEVKFFKNEKKAKEWLNKFKI